MRDVVVFRGTMAESPKDLKSLDRVRTSKSLVFEEAQLHMTEDLHAIEGNELLRMLSIVRCQVVVTIAGASNFEHFYSFTSLKILSINCWSVFN